MSENSEEMTLAAGSASSVEEEAAKWLIERDTSENWDQTNQAALDEWLNASPANLVTFWRVEAALNRSQRLRALKSERPRSSRWPEFGVKRTATGLSIAALIASAVAAYILQPTEIVYTTPVGGRETITLADNSRIELNTDTVLRATITSNRRMVTLDRGEAYFQVTHDASRPFIVTASGHRLTDLGTKFVVRSEPDRFEVAVLQGEVKFESQDGRLRQPLLLGAGDTATGAENKIYVAKKPPGDLNARLGWQRGVLIFDHTTLAEAAAEFNRYNRNKIVVADSYAGRRLIGGTFPTDSVGPFARLAHEVLGLHVEWRGNETVISR